MRKGISQIISIVILIAIAVIVGVALYFWTGGLAAKPSTPSSPRSIAVSVTECGTSSQNYTDVVISNTGSKNTDTIYTRYDLALAGGSGNEAFDSSHCDSYLDPGDSGSCRILGFVIGDGTLMIYGAEDKQIASSSVKC